MITQRFGPVMPLLPSASRTTITISMLTPAEKRLISLSQDVGYGEILDVPVRSGHPILTPTPRIKRLKRLGRQDSWTSARLQGERGFVLKAAQVQLINEVRGMINSIIIVSVQDGLPMTLTEIARLD